jgi:L-methionine (R)-S-oxide reductase
MESVFSSTYTKFEALLSQNYEFGQLLTETTLLLQREISHYDWVGFYLLDRDNMMLVLGPYTGSATEHTHIPVGKGICGQVASSSQTMVVQDVSQQANYLSCSMDVQSEIVVPIIKEGRFVAEIDIDSHAYAPFSREDEEFLSTIAGRLAMRF